METAQKPRPTPVMILKIIGLSVSMGAALGFAFYAGYNHLPYLLAPLILVEMACSPCFVIINRYLRGLLFQAHQLNNLKYSFYMGCIVLVLSIVSSFVFALMALNVIKGIDNEDFGLYIGLGGSLLAVFWSVVLIYDAKYYWKMWNRVVGSTLSGGIILNP